MRVQAGFFDIDERLKDLSAKGDELERLKGLVDFEMFRPALRQAVPRSDGSKGGRPPFDHVLMFKILVLQSVHSLSDEHREYLIKDRLSFMRFLGLGLADAVPDANTIWTFREALMRATIAGKPAIGVLFKRFDAAVKASAYLAMGRQIVDATKRPPDVRWLEPDAGAPRSRIARLRGADAHGKRSPQLRDRADAARPRPARGIASPCPRTRHPYRCDRRRGPRPVHGRARPIDARALHAGVGR